MSLLKECADHLRAWFRGLTGSKLGSSHAHELAAAFFGYPTAAALQSEAQYPLTALGEVRFLILDVACVEARIRSIRGLPPSLPDAGDIAWELAEFLVKSGRFTGKVWRADSMSDHVNDFVHDDPLMIEDALADEMANTNAFFDELLIDEVKVRDTPAAMVVTATGELNGETHEDRAFSGDKILFETTMTFGRVAGRTGYREPVLETSGGVDYSGFYDPEDA